jgi:hypothetical protein
MIPLPGYQYDASAALAFATAKLRASEPQILAQHLEQRAFRIRRHDVTLAIDNESERGVHKLANDGIAVAVMGELSQKSPAMARLQLPFLPRNNFLALACPEALRG